MTIEQETGSAIWTGHLYIIGEGDGVGVVKIGASGNPERRLKSIQTGHPRKLRIIHVEDQAGNLESYVHRLFQSRRTQGEWFDFGEADPISEVQRAVADIRAGTAVYPPRPKPKPCKTERRSSKPWAGLDPCEGALLQQVINAAVGSFFESHPDPTGHLRNLGIPAHHITKFYGIFPKYSRDPDDELEAEAATELAERDCSALRLAN